MTWKLTEWGKTRHGVTGVPWRDLSDEEFAAAEALFEPGQLRAQGYFEREPEPGAPEEEQPAVEPTEEPIPYHRPRGRARGMK